MADTELRTAVRVPAVHRWSILLIVISLRNSISGWLMSERLKKTTGNHNEQPAEYYFYVLSFPARYHQSLSDILVSAKH
jgi:hypothetical protein